MKDHCSDNVIECLKLEQSEYPKNWKVHYNLGVCQFHRKEYKEAIKNLKIALTVKEKNLKIIQNELAKISFIVAENFYQKVQYDSASYYYRQALIYHDLLNSVSQESKLLP